jgi:hypothetical protein
MELKRMLMDMLYNNIECFKSLSPVHNWLSYVTQLLQGMVNQLVSGASVAMEITGFDGDTLSKFRAFVGPADPVSMRSFYNRQN